jgi:hypothetical protein
MLIRRYIQPRTGFKVNMKFLTQLNSRRLAIDKDTIEKKRKPRWTFYEGAITFKMQLKRPGRRYIFKDGTWTLTMRPDQDLFIIQNDRPLWESWSYQQLGALKDATLRPHEIAFEFN